MEELKMPPTKAQRPHPIFFKSSRRLRLLLYLLYDSVRTGQKPKRNHRTTYRTSSGSSPVRRKRNCHYRSQHRRLRQTNRRNLSRPHRVARSNRRNRTLPYILDRTQSTDRRHHFVRRPVETIRPSFPYTSAIG